MKLSAKRISCPYRCLPMSAVLGRNRQVRPNPSRAEVERRFADRHDRTPLEESQGPPGAYVATYRLLPIPARGRLVSEQAAHAGLRVRAAGNWIGVRAPRWLVTTRTDFAEGGRNERPSSGAPGGVPAKRNRGRKRSRAAERPGQERNWPDRRLAFVRPHRRVNSGRHHGPADDRPAPCRGGESTAAPRPRRLQRVPQTGEA